MRWDAELAEDRVVGLHRVDRADLAVDDQAQELHEGKLVFGIINLPAEEGDPGPVFLGIGQKLKRIARGTGRSSQNPDDQVGVEPDELFHGLGTMVDDLQKERPPGGGDSGEHPRDHVVDVMGQHVSRNSQRDVGIENLEEVAKTLALGLFPEPMKVLERLHITRQVVIERHAVETQVGPQRALREHSRGGRTECGRDWRCGMAARAARHRWSPGPGGCRWCHWLELRE